MEPQPPKGRSIRVDPDAVSARASEPAFIARPTGAPVYYGFPVLDDVEVDGFRLGMITDWEAELHGVGDAFIVAPDGSRCGINFYVSTDPASCTEVMALERHRWGVWDVTFPYAMSSREHARLNLETVLPLLRPHWERWRETYAPASSDRSILRRLVSALRRRK